MSKPTPGPWRASHDSHGRFQLIADGIPLDPERDGAQPGEGAANAALIAAAPDLLAALVDLVDDVVSGEFYESRLVAAQEAIAKAGGAK